MLRKSLSHAIRILSNNANMVHYFNPESELVKMSDIAVKFLRDARRKIKDSPGTNSNKRSTQRSKRRSAHAS